MPLWHSSTSPAFFSSVPVPVAASYFGSSFLRSSVADWATGSAVVSSAALSWLTKSVSLVCSCSVIPPVVVYLILMAEAVAIRAVSAMNFILFVLFVLFLFKNYNEIWVYKGRILRII